MNFKIGALRMIARSAGLFLFYFFCFVSQVTVEFLLVVWPTVITVRSLECNISF